MKTVCLMLVMCLSIATTYAQGQGKAEKKTAKKLEKQQRMYTAKNGNQMMRNLNKAAKKQDKASDKLSKGK